jgi:hypothetical protein
MFGRAYPRQSVGRHPYPQLVGAYPQLVGGYPQLVGRGGYPQHVGAYPQQLANFAPPGAVAYSPDPGGAMVYPMMGNNPGSTGTVLVDGVPTITRQWPFPMPDAAAGPGAPTSSANTAQLIVRPTRLTIAETTGPSVLTDIAVGQRSQFINRGGVVPVAMFGPTATDSLVNFDTAQIGNSITLDYLNNGLASTIISSALLCVTAAY